MEGYSSYPWRGRSRSELGNDRHPGQMSAPTNHFTIQPNRSGVVCSSFILRGRNKGNCPRPDIRTFGVNDQINLRSRIRVDLRSIEVFHTGIQNRSIIVQNIILDICLMALNPIITRCSVFLSLIFRDVDPGQSNEVWAPSSDLLFYRNSTIKIEVHNAFIITIKIDIYLDNFRLVRRID